MADCIVKCVCTLPEGSLMQELCLQRDNDVYFDLTPNCLAY